MSPGPWISRHGGPFGFGAFALRAGWPRYSTSFIKNPCPGSPSRDRNGTSSPSSRIASCGIVRTGRVAHPAARRLARRIIPLIETFEPRIVLSGTGFLQGTVYTDSNANNQFDPSSGDTPLAQAQVQLIQNNTVLQTITTGSDGAFLFTGLDPGIYTVNEIPPSTYTNSGTQANAPLSPVQGSTSSSITVQVLDLSSLSVTYNAPYQYASLEPSTIDCQASADGGNTYQTIGAGIGQLPITVTYPGGSTPQFTSYCVEAFSALDYGVDTFTASGLPLSSTLVPATNAGAIGYLYETYGALTAQPPANLNQAYNLQALQLAIWKLEYDSGSNLSSFSTGNIKDVSILTQYNGFESVQNDPSVGDLTNRALAYVQEGLKYSEPAVELLATSGPNGYQSVLAPASLNFGNVPKASPTINTQASASPSTVVGTALLTDQATLSGGDNPGGSISFSLTAPDGITTPEGSVTVNGDGTYSSPTSVLATEVGIYTWHATYSGDDNNNGASDNGANEGVTTVMASPAINTQATASPSTMVGTAMLTDQATLSGGDNPGGSISFSLTAPDGITTPEGSVTVNGDGTYSSPTSVLATEVGIYTWHATYSGDTNNNGATDNGVNEGVTTIMASPGISTTPGGSVTLGGITINGTKYLDQTGNGFSSDDSPQNGVTINLYSSNWTLVASTTTSGSGTYSFAVASPGTYYVRESVPSGYVQTGGGPNGAPGTPTTHQGRRRHQRFGLRLRRLRDPQLQHLRVVRLLLHGDEPDRWPVGPPPRTRRTSPATRSRATRSRSSLPSKSSSTYTLVVYTAPTSYFSDSNAYQQVIYQSATGSYCTAANTTIR